MTEKPAKLHLTHTKLRSNSFQVCLYFDKSEIMERYFMFLVVHDAVNQEDCQCLKDVVPTLQSLVKVLKEFSNQENNVSGDIDNNQYSLCDPFLALKDVSSPTVYFSIVEDKLFTHQLECCSKWQKGEHLEELSSALDKPVNAQGNADEISSDKDIEISDRLHQLADSLPDQAGVPVDLFWFICAKNNMAIRSHLHLFGALKRLQQWNNANITVLCSNEFDRDTFSTTWERGLKISLMQVNRNDPALKLFDQSVVWQGSLVFCEDQSSTRLPGFNLCCDKSKKNVQLHPKRRQRQKRTSTDVWNSDLYIAPEITILCKVQKHTVPLHMFVPVKLGLADVMHSKLSRSSAKTAERLVEWLSFEINKDVAFVGSLKLVAPSKNHLKEKNKEAWLNFVESESNSATSTDSQAEDDDSDCCRRLCLICGGAEKELNLFVLRAPEHLNGRIQHDLAVIHSSVSIVNDQEVGGPLRFPDLTDSFLETEQKLTEVLLCRLQQELSDSSSDGQLVDPSNELLDQLISAKWNLLKEKREQLLRAGKKCELEVVRQEALQHDKRELAMSPSRWPERAWLIKNDPNAIVKDAIFSDSNKHFPLLASVTTLSVQDILEKFHLDGTAAASDLSPVKPREEASRDRHIQISTKRGVKDVKENRYPEALAASYHGIEYCLDDRAAIAKDSQLASLQSSYVKLETLSSCVKTDLRPIESRARRATTKAAKNDKKQNLMKLSVPLIKTKTAGKSRKLADVGRPLKRKSPIVKKPAVAVKRKREELSVKEELSQTTKEENKKETRSERHKRRLRQVVQKTLEDNGIDSNHAFYKSCTERLYSLCKSFLKDLRSSHGLNDEMKRLASSNVQQVIEFEAKRTATQET